MIGRWTFGVQNLTVAEMDDGRSDEYKLDMEDSKFPVAVSRQNESVVGKVSYVA